MMKNKTVTLNKYENKKFDFICNGDIHIGNAGAGRDSFLGKIDFIEIYKEALSPE